MVMVSSIVAAIGTPAGLIGLFVLIAAAHRPLATIDALPLETAGRFVEAAPQVRQ